MTAEQNWIRLELRHAVTAAGRVIDAVTGKPMPGCRVEITSGPPEFDRLRALLAQDLGWQARRERLDRTHTRTDGIYVFLSLPPGQYRLRVTAPTLGGPNGQMETGGSTIGEPRPAGGYAGGEATFTVFDERDAAGRVQVDPIEVTLSPTRLRGRVTRLDDGEPIMGAKVRLRGDSRTLKTDAEGRYEFGRLVATRLTVEASAPGFVAATRDPIAITPGGDHTVDFALEAD